MIFVTVGVQLPFDRLIETVDRWAAGSGREDVFAQIGSTSLRPSHIRWKDFVDPAEYRERMTAADVVVAHAGIGSLLTALELGKPILVLPRRAELGEHRNDHQMATAKRFADQDLASVAFDEIELERELQTVDSLQGSRTIAPDAPTPIIETLRSFIRAKELEAATQPSFGARLLARLRGSQATNP